MTTQGQPVVVPRHHQTSDEIGDSNSIAVEDSTKRAKQETLLGISDQWFNGSMVRFKLFVISFASTSQQSEERD